MDVNPRQPLVMEQTVPDNDPVIPLVAKKILVALEKWQSEHQAPFPGWIIVPLNVARDIDMQQRRRGDFMPESTIRAGDKGSIWGVRCIVADVDEPMLAEVIE